DIFMTDFADLNLGSFDPGRSTWHKIKAFPHNVELEVAATFSGGRRFSFFGPNDDSVIDERGKTVILHYGLCQLPDSGYQPRLADDRVGYFLSVVKDFSSDSPDTSFVRFVNRWRLERAEPIDSKHPNKLSPPKKKIVFWIEKSVPDEFRAAVREGILEWNKAFEKIGFRDAIEVRQQEENDRDDFDPENIDYHTFRWITNDLGFDMGPSRANPLTGEILDADIIFDASMVRFWREEAKLFRGDNAPASLIQATRQGWGLVDPLASARSPQAGSAGWNDPKQTEQNQRKARLLAARHGLCQCGAHMRYELSMAAMALVARGVVKPGDKIPDELIQQAVKETTMHEVGHTLGLRHNFKASSMLKNEQLHDTSITRKQGLIGSVMDYAPINLAPKGVKQGDYFTTTIGPYDYWAIAYAYKPLSGGTDGELEKLQDIAKQSAKPGHDYATDEDMFDTSDPLVNVWDLGADP
ncbi:MAG: zinc-dependent metalloprotease, partial [Gemmataceae bacterium]